MATTTFRLGSHTRALLFCRPLALELYMGRSLSRKEQVWSARRQRSEAPQHAESKHASRRNKGDLRFFPPKKNTGRNSNFAEKVELCDVSSHSKQHTCPILGETHTSPLFGGFRTSKPHGRLHSSTTGREVLFSVHSSLFLVVSAPHNLPRKF